MLVSAQDGEFEKLGFFLPPFLLRSADKRLRFRFVAVREVDHHPRVVGVERIGARAVEIPQRERHEPQSLRLNYHIITKITLSYSACNVNKNKK